MIALIDYGAGNLTSVRKALTALIDKLKCFGKALDGLVESRY